MIGSNTVRAATLLQGPVADLDLFVAELPKISVQELSLLIRADLTSRWKEGEVLREPMRLEIPKGTPGGEYTLQVAIYDLASGQFLLVEDERWRADGERVLLGSVVIEP